MKIMDSIIQSFFKLFKLNVEPNPPETAQDTIPYKTMYPDGVCYIDGDLYNMTFEFFDTNYQLSDTDRKKGIFDGWEDLLNGFNENMVVQISFLNQKINEYENDMLVRIHRQDDDFDVLREELETFLKHMQRTSNEGVIKRKFLTIGVHAENLNVARTRLTDIQLFIEQNYKRIDAKIYRLSGKERLHLLFRSMNRNRPFNVNWKDLEKQGKSTKDAIAPSGFDFSKSGMFKMGNQVCNSFSIDLLAEQLNDRFLPSILSIDQSMLISMNISVYPTAVAQKKIRTLLSDLERKSIDAQKKSSQDGVFENVIPPQLKEEISQAEDLLSRITEGNQKLFNLTFVLTCLGDNLSDLSIINEKVNTIITHNNCIMRPLNFQQEQGFITSLPLGVQKINQNRDIPSRALAICIPFINVSLFDIGKYSIYYGRDPITKNLIMADRKKLRNPNGLFLGTPGAGKSFAVKLEIFLNFLRNNEDDFLIIDPENEYEGQTSLLHGENIEISPTTKNYINPLDISLYTDDEDGDPLILKTDFLLSFFSLIMEEKLDPAEKTIISRCVPIIYKDLVDEFEQTGVENPDKVPILEDIYNALLQMNDEQDPQVKVIANRLAISLELYVKGQYKVFNHRTEVDLSNRLICFNTKKLGGIASLGMLTVQEQLWKRVKINRQKNKTTRTFMDEFHLLLKDPQTASYSIEIWKRFRKWGGIPTGITQNVGDFLLSNEIANILENTDFFVLLNQGAGDRKNLMQRLNISEQLGKYITNAEQGTGLIIYDNIQLPFENPFPKKTEMYKVMTTKQSDLKEFQETQAM